MSNNAPVAYRYKDKDDEQWLLAYDHPGTAFDQVEGLDPRGWRCWHCGEFFTVSENEKARSHFGRYQDDPQCIVPKETWQAMTHKIEHAQKERDMALRVSRSIQIASPSTITIENPIEINGILCEPGVYIMAEESPRRR